MKNEEISLRELLCESHIGLTRQGPGSPDMTEKALGFLEPLEETSQVADLGCGTGGQTMVLAQNIAGTITGLDYFPDFIQVFNENARRLNLQDRVRGVVGSMENLPFPKETLDLIWSEGAIDSIGFEKGLGYWHGFLKKGGSVAVTCATWLTQVRPYEIEKWWVDAVADIGTVWHNISILEKTGYQFTAAFTLPETCWTDHYFLPRAAAEKALEQKYPNNPTVEEYLRNDQYEMELYEKYKQYYGYVFYLGQKR